MKKTKLTRSLMAAVSIVALSAVMYGCVHSSDDPPQLIDEDAEMKINSARQVASEALAAARTASANATAQLDAVAADADADPASYIEARDAAAAAKAALEAAMAANQAAQDAETVADAEAARDLALAAQADAEAAEVDAEMYAGMVTTAADAARNAAEVEATALRDARTDADEAAGMAESSASDAADEVAAVMADASADQASYDEAVAARDAAMAAATAARAASDAADRAATSAEAIVQRDIAREKRDEAATALGNAETYAGMVAQAKIDADELAAAMKLLADTKQEASDAARDAMDASTEASAVVEAQRANKDLNTIAAAAFARAEDAAADAAKASGDAAVANNAAQAAVTQEDAAKYRDQAVAAKRAAELAEANAISFAGIVQGVKTAMDNAASEMEMLAEAKKLAGEAATEARQDATDADEAAKAAEAAAPGSTDATDARAAAKAADTAAGLAEAANMMAQGASDSETAGRHQMEARRQANIAAGQLTVAEDNRDEAVDARKAAEQLQEERDLKTAKDAAEALWSDMTDGIMFHYNAVMDKAGLASGQATTAMNSANKAMAARTDYTNAKKQADAAKAASDEAQASLARAMTAKGEADTARKAAMDATESADAQKALADLRAANAKLTEEHTGMTGAGMDYMAAKMAAEEAAKYAGVHVIGLLRHANGSNITFVGDQADEDIAKALADARKTRLDAVVAEIAMSANEERNGDGTTATTASVSWAADTEADPEATPAVEFAAGEFMITLNPAGTGDLEFRLEAAAEDDTATTLVDETIVTAMKLQRGLGDFDHGYAISDRGNYGIVFTDKMQATLAVPAMTVALTNTPVSVSRIVENEFTQQNTATPTTTELTNAELDDAAGLTANARYDHDGNPDTLALEGTFSCAGGAAAVCTIQVTDQNVVSVSGNGSLVFSTDLTNNRHGITKAAEAPDPMDEYLAFGVWLRTDDDTTTVGDQPGVAAFADSGAGLPDFITPVGLYGTATFTGSATGLYTAGSSVDYFEGRARLIANFGDTPDEGETDAAGGTVTGTIDQIVAGGDSSSDVINLFSDADPDNGNIDNAVGSFEGFARMGDPTVDGDSATYIYNGRWDGQFYGVAAESGEETTTMPTAAGGTFGVTGTDDMGTTTGDNAMDDDVIRSYVGAFGTYKAE